MLKPHVIRPIPRHPVMPSRCKEQNLLGFAVKNPETKNRTTSIYEGPRVSEITKSMPRPRPMLKSRMISQARPKSQKHCQNRRFWRLSGGQTPLLMLAASLRPILTAHEYENELWFLDFVFVWCVEPSYSCERERERTLDVLTSASLPRTKPSQSQEFHACSNRAVARETKKQPPWWPIGRQPASL